MGKLIKTFPKSVLGAAAGLLLLMFSADAFAHGFISKPASRAALGKENNAGNVQYEPQSLEALKGFPQAGPPDGQIASAGGHFGGLLDEQTSTRWIKHTINQGKLSVTWTLTAPHKATKWHYYITKPGWNQNQKLRRADLQPLEVFPFGGVLPPKSVAHEITIPSTHTGYHIILGVWDIDDTVNAFYQVVDVDIKGGHVAVPPIGVITPPTPNTPVVTNVEATTAHVSYSTPTTTGVTGYEIIDTKNQSILATTSATSETLRGLTSNTEYKIAVRAFNKSGERSPLSAITTFKTKALAGFDNQPPTKVESVHSMGTTSNSIDLMWLQSTDNVGVTGYSVYNAKTNQLITKVTSNRHMISGLTPGTEYSFYVTAHDAANNVSPRSDVYTTKTEGGGVNPGNPNEYNPSQSYPTVGTVVTYQGNTYQSLWWINANAYPNPADKNGSSTGWKLISGPATSNVEWNKDVAYSAGDEVTHNGKRYVATYWTKGNEPGKEQWGPWKLK